MKSNKLIRILSIALSILVATGLAGCSGKASENKTAGIKIQGGIVRTTVSSEPDNLDPYISAATDTQSIMLNVFEGLMGFTEKGQIVTQLAEKESTSSDGLTYTFNLRKGVKFHNGSKFSAEDVKYSYDKLAGLSGSKALSSKYTGISKVEVKDANTVAITLKQPDVSFLSKCTIAIVPKDYTNQSQKPVGTGPFKFSQYIPGQKVVLEKNNDYYDSKRKATIDKVEFRIMTDPNAIVMALKSGDLDEASIQAKDVEGLKADFNIMQTPQNMVQLFALNNSVKPFNNLKVRQAINYAIDKDQIIKTVAQGYGTKLSSNMSPIMNVYFQDGLDKYKTNIAKAKQLLKEAGYENGFSTTVTVPSNYKFHVDTAQVIADQLSKIGIKLEIKQIEWGQWLDQVYTKANYDSTIIGFTGKLDPNDVLIRYASKYPKNFVKFNNAEYDQLINKATNEASQAQRVKMYKECQKILVDQAASVFIMDPSAITASKKNLKGFKNYPVQFWDMSGVYYTK